MAEQRKSAVVIGAGISGLVCAYRLKELGIDAALLERSDRVGGVIQTEAIDGFLIERGPNSAQGTEELVALVQELGIIDELVEGDPKAPAFVYFEGRLHQAPAGVGQFLKSDLLSLAGKLRIFKEPFVRARRSETEESVAAFARRRIGREAAERMVAPFVSGIYAGDAEQLSVQAAFPRLANLEASYGGLFRGALAKARAARQAKREARQAKKDASVVMDKAAPTRRRLCSFRTGMGHLPGALAARIGEDLMTGCEQIALSASQAEAASQGGEGFTVRFERAGSEQQITCGRVIIATPSRPASTLLASVSPELSRLLGEISYPPLAIVSLAYDRASIRNPLVGFGFLVAPSEKMNILGCVWNSSLFQGRAPAGKALLTAFVGGARNPAAVKMGDAELVASVHGELLQALGISSEPRVVAITRWERAIPQYNLGHAERVRKIEGLVEGVPGLTLIGNYLHGVSTGDCIKEADRAARSLPKTG